MDEITSIADITRLDVVKVKRSCRKGRITRLKTKLDDAAGKRPSALSLKTLTNLREDLSREIRIYDALQARYEHLLSEMDSPEAQYAEELETALDIADSHIKLQRRLEDLRTSQTHYNDAIKLRSDCDTFSEVANPDVAEFEKDCSRLQKKINTFLQQTLTTEDEDITTLREWFKARLEESHRQLNKCREKRAQDRRDRHAADSDSSTDRTRSTSGPKIKLELPTFSGNPTDWMHFHKLFTSALDTRGSSFSDREKVCLLLNAMKHPEAERIVRLHSFSDDGYSQAMEALVDKYGLAMKIFPHLVKKTLHKEPIDFTEEGFARLRERILIPFQAMEECGCATLSQYLTALVCEDFTPRLRDEWTKHLATKKDVPNLKDLFEYAKPLEHTLSSISTIAGPSRDKPSHHQRKPAFTSSTKSTFSKNCILCHEPHRLHQCPVFLGYDVQKRIKYAKEQKRCTNCLSDRHSWANCPSSHTCRKCEAKHNTLLHKEDAASGASLQMLHTATKPLPTSESPEDSPPKVAFLHTALVKVKNGSQENQARIAMDTGASSSLITEALASRLKLRRYPQRLTLAGAYGSGISKCFVKAELFSLHNEDQHVTIKFSVVSKLPSAYPPNRKEEIAANPHLKDLALADPDFGGPLDALIGTLDYGRCILGSLTYNLSSDIAVQPTLFGWTVTGPMDYTPPASAFYKIQTVEDTLHEDLSLLWAIDKTPETSHLRPADEEIVNHFKDTHSIKPDGRYSVKLPRVSNPPELGLSRNMALRRFQQNERSLSKKGKLEEFNNALKDYLTSEHAKTVPADELTRDHYYLPVHGVFKDTSTTTKVRPVFDASARSSTGASLNDTLHIGLNLYPLLSDLLLRFRQYKIGFSSDISKMFREVELHESERDLHRFLLRNDSGAINDCRMQRLTFGVRPSPYLATQVIQDLAKRYSATYPIASKAILNDFYVDDFVSGADSVEAAQEIRTQLCELLRLAQMTLRKWRTSSDAFRDTIPKELVETEDLQLVSSEKSLKALGIHWDVAQDCLRVPSPEIDSSVTPTKRIVASVTAKVFDILGFFAPTTILAKMLLQKLWISKVTWDQPLPEELLPSWEQWIHDIPAITSHPIIRRYTSNDAPVRLKELHGFSDASKDAYGAVIYLRQLHEDGTISISMVIAKARVSPLKGLTIPRAELLAAYLMIKLLDYAAQTLHITPSTAWTDSAIVLCWMRKMPSSLNAFVANRVMAIQEILPDVKWKHISTTQNPADLLSRGMSATNLQASALWWQGPPWLKLPEEEWPRPQFSVPKDVPEVKAITLLNPPTNKTTPIWEGISPFHHLVRVCAWIRRFYSNVRKPKDQRNLQQTLTSDECKKSKDTLIFLSQQETFEEVFAARRRGTQLSKGHSLAKFNLYYTDTGLLKLTTRVRDPRLQRQPKTVIPLSLKSGLTRLLVESEHRRLLHAGTATLMAILGDTYYIPALRNFLKGISRRCPACQRAYNRNIQQPMGLLPSVRTTPSPPFTYTGLDFAGPFIIKRGHTRRPVLIKSYVCLFVCLSVKAVHLELCADLSTEEFLAALRRFCGRRGKPVAIYSDNGSNFIGANNELKEIRQLLARSSQGLSHFCGDGGISWNFIPPLTPHFGGIWEAGVKSMKMLMRKVLSPHALQFRELASILVEIEAILNSRPMTPLNSVEADNLVLTPGHFLIGRPLVALQTKPADTSKITTLRRWQLVQRLSQDLWTTWKTQYLQSMQARSKWRTGGHQLHVGDLVFLKEETFTYRRWPLARVTAIYPGDDHITRAVDVDCEGKIYRRSTRHLIPLNIEETSSGPPVCSGRVATVEQTQDSSPPAEQDSEEQDSTPQRMPLQ